MSNIQIQKIIFIVLIIIITISLFVFIVMPNFSSSTGYVYKINQERTDKSRLEADLHEFLAARDKYHMLNAEYQNLCMQLPHDIDITVLTNEIYDIARYADVDIQYIDFADKTIADTEDENEKNIGVIESNLILEGSYYQILSFINTIEIMPRVIRIEDIAISTGEESYNRLIAYVSFESYFDKNYETKNK